MVTKDEAAKRYMDLSERNRERQRQYKERIKHRGNHRITAVIPDDVYFLIMKESERTGGSIGDVIGNAVQAVFGNVTSNVSGNKAVTSSKRIGNVSGNSTGNNAVTDIKPKRHTTKEQFLNLIIPLVKGGNPQKKIAEILTEQGYRIDQPRVSRYVSEARKKGLL